MNLIKNCQYSKELSSRCTRGDNCILTLLKTAFLDSAGPKTLLKLAYPLYYGMGSNNTKNCLSVWAKNKPSQFQRKYIFTNCIYPSRDFYQEYVKPLNQYIRNRSDLVYMIGLVQWICLQNTPSNQPLPEGRCPTLPKELTHN